MSRQNNGFTLVELLVAVALTAVITWGLAMLLTSSIRFTSAVSTETELSAAGRALLDRAARDLRTVQPLSVGYLAIERSGDFDAVQLVSSCGADGQLVHVRYAAIEASGTSRHLGRAMRLPDMTAPLSAPCAFAATDLANLGIAVDQFQVTYLVVQGGQVVELGGPKTFGAGDSLPIALCLQARLRDARSGATITLKVSVPLPAAGV